MVGFDSCARVRAGPLACVRAGPAGRLSHPARAAATRVARCGANPRRGKKGEDRGEWLTDTWAQAVGG
jgi:hypothetical protein